MARLIPFASDALTEQLDAEAAALAAPEQQSGGASTKAELERIARETSVPVNVLMALAEKDGAADGASAIASAQKHAANLKGKDMSGLDPAILDRADAIGRAVYPGAKNVVRVKTGVARVIDDTTRAAAGSVTKAIGGGIAAVGTAIDEAVPNSHRITTDPTTGEPRVITDEGAPGTALGRGIRAVGDFVHGRGEATQDRMSETAKRKQGELLDPKADITDPGSWGLGENPTAEGALYAAIDVFGSMAPVIASAVATRGRSLVVPAATGGAIGGGSAGIDAADAIDRMAKEIGEDGTSKLERESKVYRDFLGQGMSPDEAVQRTKEEARRMATILTAPVSGLGGAATGAIMTRPIAALAGKGAATRIAGTAAISAAEEAAQETAEGVAQKHGMNVGAGTNEDLTEGSFNDALLGAVAGGAPGAVAGAFHRGEREAVDPAAAAAEGEPAPAPAPPTAEMPPGPGAGPGTAPPPPGAAPPAAPPTASPAPTGDPLPPGAIAPEGAALDPDLLQAAAAPATQPPAFDPPPPRPKGRFERALEAAPPPLVRATPGQTIAVTDATTGEVFEGVFVDETPAGATVNLGGSDMLIPRSEIEQGLAVFDLPRPPVAAPVDDIPWPDPVPRPQQETASHEQRRPGDDELAAVPLQPDAGFAAPDAQRAGDPRPAEDGHPDALAGQGVPELGAEPDIAAPGSPAGPDALGGVAAEPDAGIEPRAVAAPAAAPEPTPAAKPDPAPTAAPVPDPAPAPAAAPAPAPQPDPAAAERRPVDPLRAALEAAVKAGEAQHTTKKGKALTGYVAEGLTPGQAKGVDPYAFKKDGGWFIRSERAREHYPDLGTAPVEASPLAAAAPVAQAALEAAPEPSEAQKEAGNYRKGHARWHGLDLSIENPKGGERRGVGRDGKEWSVTMPANYGYFRNSEASDGDHVDFYMGPNEDAPFAYVIDQIDADTGAYDEAKVMLGFDNPQDARAAHEAAFSDGRGAARMGGITKMPVSDLKGWLANGDTKNPVSPKAKALTRAASKPNTVSDGTGGADGRKASRAQQDGRVSDLEGDQDTLHQSEQHRLAQLRRQGDNDAPSAGEQLPQLPSGSGGEAQPAALDRTEGQQPRLRAGEHPLGDQGGAEQQQAHEPPSDGERKDRDPDAMGSGDGANAVRNPAAIEARGEPGRGGEPEPDGKETAAAERPADARRADQAGEGLGAREGLVAGDDPQSDQVGMAGGTAPGPADAKGAGTEARNGTVRSGSVAPQKSGRGFLKALNNAKGPKAKWRLRGEATADYFAPGNIVSSYGSSFDRVLSFDPQSGTVTVQKVSRSSGEWADVAGEQPRTHRTLPDDRALETGPTQRAPVVSEAPTQAGTAAEPEPQPPSGDALLDAAFDDVFGAEPASETPPANLSRGILAMNVPGTTPAPTRAPSPAKPRAQAAVKPRSAKDAAASAVQNTAAGVAGIVDGLNALFGADPNRLNSGLAFDEKTYEKAKPMFSAAVRAFGKAGQDIADLARAMVRGLAENGLTRKAQENMRPFLTRFIEDMRAGTVDPFAESTVTEPAQGAKVEGQAPAPEATPDDNRPDGSDDRASAAEGADPAEPRAGRDGEGSARGGEPGARDAGPGREDQRPGAERGADGERAGVSGRAGGTDRVTPAKVGPRNHVIETGDLRVKGGEKTRARNSVKAIEMLRTLEAEGREANDSERQVLALYGGAGTLAAALPNSEGRVRMADIGADLDRLLTPEEKASLTKTSQYAFYTAEPVLRGMWSLAQQLGFQGGKVFEPGMGVGGFVGTMPKGVMADYRGIELDPITAKIAAKLYPQSRIENGDYIKTPMLRDYYDLVIGNPPFARTQVLADPEYPQGFMIHDYFFAKSLDAVRPGGLLMFVTSAGTMNKMDSSARDYLADRADLVGAMRLPNTAFEENGTQVTTDIIVLRKRLPGEAEADPSWRQSPPVEVPGKDGGTETLPVNAYFQAHPEMILGEQGAFDTLVGRPRIGVRPRAGSDLAADLAEAIRRFPRSVMSAASPVQMMTGPRDDASNETKSGSYYLKDGELWQFDGREGKKVEGRGAGVKGGRTKAEIELVTALVPLRNALREVYAADLAEADGAAARKKLNDLYDAFVAKRGPINKAVRTLRRPSVVEMEGLRQQAAEDARASGAEFDIGSFDGGAMIAEGATLAQVAAARKEAASQPGYREGDFDPAAVPDKVVTTFPNIDAFADDPENFRLRAIEKYDERTDTATKTRVFSENAVKRSVQATIRSPEDALLAQLAETGRIDLRRIAEAAGTTIDLAREELAGKIFLNPVTGEYETRTKYLSGNVRQKLQEARDASAKSPQMQRNVDELEAVQPPPIPRTEISVPIGAHWFDADLYSQFAQAKGLRLKASFKRALGIWTVDGDNHSAAARNDFGTADLPFADLMRRVMNNKPIRVQRTVKEADGSTRTYVDEEATQAANDKAMELRRLFPEWLWSDEDRAGKLEDAYNAAFNAEVAPKYDGGYLTTPGVHSDWRWRPHQTAVVARILQSGNTYMAHTVGAGKTSAMIGAGMEARRLGLARKPMYAVPNHMLVQFATEFQHQYPLANILVADEKRFEADKRKQFVADAAMGDYDAIIITHSAMGKIPNSDAAKARVVEGILSDIREMMDAAGETGDRGKDAGQQQATLGALNSVAAALGIKVEKEKGVSTAKKIAQLMEQAEQRITKMTSDARKDDVFTMDELGVDMLFVDEAHLFRKLSFATTNGNIKGIDPAGSQAAMDLFIKSRIVDERNPGRGLIFASGTPITNTMAELYTVSRFLQPQALEARGIAAFDAWAATFGEVASELEQNPDGSYKEVARFSRFVNTPELSLMVRQMMDVVSGPDLEQYVTRPKLKGGSRSLVVVEATPEQRAYQDTLAGRMRAIANRKGPVKKGDDILLSVIGDGRLSAIDPRLVDPDASGRGSKLERMIENIYRRWKEGAEVPLHGVKPEGGYTDKPIMRGPSTQIVFATLGIEASKHNPDFSVHRYIKASLVRQGVPAAEIILAGDLKTHAHKQRAFNDVNEGKARILIGSKSLFTGVNAQKRIAAIHNLDPLWFPADDEQRNGRGIRQGNMNPEIEILDYSTKGTYDATMWQMMGRKAGFIEAFFRGDPTQRDMEDLGEASVFEQAKAMTTRDPRVLQLTELKAEWDKLNRRKGAIDSQRARLRAEIRSYAGGIDHASKMAAEHAALEAKVVDLAGDAFTAKLGGETFTKRKDFGEALISAADKLAASDSSEAKAIGEISGFPIVAQFRKSDRSIGLWLRLSRDHESDIGWSDDPVGLARRAEGAARTPIELRAHYEKQVRGYTSRAAEAKAALAKVNDFAEQDKLNAIGEQIQTLQAEMLADSDKDAAASKEQRGTARFTPGDGRRVAAAARERLRGLGLTAPVEVTSGRPGVRGETRGGIVRLFRTDAGWRHTLDHEAMHILRERGLIRPDEWKALVRAARAKPGLMATVDKAYADLPSIGRMEEAVAEMFADWRKDRDAAGLVQRAFERIASVFRALGSALRGEGFVDAARIMERIAAGEIGGRGPDGPGGGRPRGPDGRFVEREQRDMPDGAPERRLVGQILDAAVKRAGRVGREAGKDAANMARDVAAFGRRLPGEVKKRGTSEGLSYALTDAMGLGEGGKWSILGLVPGRALFNELGKALPSARTYLREKDAMDALRNDWHAKADATAQDWRRLLADEKANSELMDIMHEATLTGVDPSEDFTPLAEQRHHDLADDPTAHEKQREWARDMIARDGQRASTFADLKARFEALPEPYREMFGRVRNQYSELADAIEEALIENVERSMKAAARKAQDDHDKRMREIDDEGLKGAEREAAIKDAKDGLTRAKARAAFQMRAKVAGMRSKFEANRLAGPYFPLARFGDYFVTLRNDAGEVVSFSRFQTQREQSEWAKDAAGEGWHIERGVLSNAQDLRGAVDPGFVAEIEAILSDASVDEQVMDQVWQRWLNTLPDMSLRKNRIHRKGRAGFNRDAFRAFGKQMFHGSHQLARLKHGVNLSETLVELQKEAARAADPVRAGLVVNEMNRRHAFTMNPTGNAAAQAMTSAAFVWYLAASPAAAMVNVSQTSVVGIPILRAAFRAQGASGAAKELGQALADFTRGKGHAATSARLTADEKGAMEQAYRLGVIDKSQAHDLAGVGETGVEYSDVRARWMAKLSWFFHHAERMNREVTFLAAYRMARKDGAGHDAAIETAGDLTWKVHFDYQNCVDGETEILTLTGWKKHDELRAGDRIISTDDDGRAVEIGVQEVNVFHRPQEVAIFRAGSSRNFAMAVTDDHKCVVVKEQKTGRSRGWTRPYFEMAKDLDQRHHILRAPLAPLDRPDTIGVEMAALIGWFVAEGWFAKNRGCSVPNATRIEQSQAHNPEHVAEIDGILSRLGASFSRHEVKNGRHVLWSITGDMNRALRKHCPDKKLTWDMFATMSGREMSAVLDAFAKADGAERGKNGCVTISQKASTNRQNLEVLQAMATAIGRTASLGEGRTRDSTHLMLPGNGRIKTRKTAVRHLTKTRLQVPMVWCPTTDNGRWIARRNGVVFVTGNTSRPRAMQGDTAKVLLTFRNFTVNMLWRLARDSQQALTAEKPEDRAVARAQLMGITTSMMLHAGIKGTWGYGILMTLAGLFFAGGGDDAEEELKKLLVGAADADGIGAALRRNLGGMLLNGAPGHVTGTSLSERLGMGNLWMRESGRIEEGRDAYLSFLEQIAGPVGGLVKIPFLAAHDISEGHVERAAEGAVPKFVRDGMKAGRYLYEGVVTRKGDDIVPEISPYQALVQALGFTPAQVAERYEANNRMMNKQERIVSRRSALQKEAGTAIMAGKPIPQAVLDQITAFNLDYPEYPITGTTLRQSISSRKRASDRNEFGIALNPKLNERIRGDQARMVYD